MTVMKKVCVTGAGGFLGKALCKALISNGFEVHALGRKSYPDLKAAGAIVHTIDIYKEADQLKEIFQNTETVFHAAAKVDMWGAYQDFFNTNVVGTRNVIAACRHAGVENLIYTSSPSVVADGNNLSNIDESYKIPEKHQAPYPATKAIAESEVIKANSESLRTIALRPHLIFGPGDNHFIPTIIERAQKGRLIIVGDGRNIVDVCFIEDCVQAHLCAQSALSNNPKAAGKAYFISQGDPIKLWEFIDRILEAHGLKKLTRRIPKNIALLLAGFFELTARISPIKIKPLFTKFLVCEMTTDHYFDISAAKDLLGFVPKYSVQEAITKSFQHRNNYN